MKQSPRGTENAEALKDRLKHDSSTKPTPGEIAGGKPEDLPGGSYDVPREEAERRIGERGDEREPGD